MSNTSLDGVHLTNWYQCGINLTEASVNSLINSFLPDETIEASPQPGVYLGYFDADTLYDTFFNSTGWTKGQLFINGYNIGRYWAALGPQA